MSDYDELHYCPSCQEATMFNLSGSGNNGTCMECETEYNNGKQLKLLHRAVNDKHLQARLVFDNLFGNFSMVSIFERKEK